MSIACAPETRSWTPASPEEARQRIRTNETPVTGPPVVLVTLHDGQMNVSMRYLYAALTGARHLTKVIRFGLTGAYQHDVDYSVFQTLKVKFPLARPRATEAEVEEFGRTIRELRPLWVGFNTIAPLNHLTARLTEEVRRNCGAPVVWGGYLAINEPEFCIQHADVVCIGEGEEVAVEITEELKNGGGDFSQIEGVWYRGDKGVVIKNPRRPLLTPEQMEQVPFIHYERTQDEILIPKNMIEWYDRALEKCNGGNANSATVVHDVFFTRGCHFTCSYCHHNVQRERDRGLGQYYRTPSPDWVVEQCKDAKHRLNKRRLLIWDDIFPFQKEWLERFVPLYKREIGLPFSLNLHTKLINPENIDLLVEAGMDSCNIGFQSGSERIRRGVFKRPETNDEIVENAERIASKVVVCYDTIIDNPFETAEDVRESFLLFLRFPHPFIVDTNTLLFFRNQELTNRALAEGLIREEHILGVRPDPPVDDVTCSPFLPRTDVRKRSMTMLTVATQYEFIPKKTLLAWSEDEELVNDDRLMAMHILQALYAHTRHKMYDLQWYMEEYYGQLQERGGVR